MEKLDRRSFLFKTCRWCAGLGGLYLDGNLVSCSNEDVESRVAQQQTSEPTEREASQFAVRVNERCTGCGKCTRGICPEDAIRLEGDRATISEACRGCGRCVGACPRGAIELVEPAIQGSSQYSA